MSPTTAADLKMRRGHGGCLGGTRDSQRWRLGELRKVEVLVYRVVLWFGELWSRAFRLNGSSKTVLGLGTPMARRTKPMDSKRTTSFPA